MTKKKPYGLWSSPLTPEMMAGALRLKDVAWSSDAETIVWLEGRSGANILVAKKGDEAARDLTTGTPNVRAGVGYGGGDFDVHGEVVVFAGGDGRLYRVEIGHGNPRPITPPFGGVASPCISPDGQWVLYVHTDHRDDCLAIVDMEGARWPTKLVSGADFYMQPTWHPHNNRIAWIEWDQPNMPWDATALCSARLTHTNGGPVLGEVERDFEPGRAMQQPAFSPSGSYLAFLSDASGFWQVMLRDISSGEERALSDAEDADHAYPAWVQGMRYLAWAPEDNRVYALKNRRGIWSLRAYGVDGSEQDIELVDEGQPYQSIEQIRVSNSGEIAAFASAPSIPGRLIRVKPNEAPQIVKRSSGERLRSEALAPMEPVRWTHSLGDEEVEVFGNYYAPTNPGFEASGKPPAIVSIHGGPTSQRTAAFDGRNQFFASRGFAVLDVNYRGSTGYGREYMEALYGNWGLFDVQDAVSAATYLAEEGLADASKIAIMGGSAGGYTVLQSLVSYPGHFGAGISLYGISNLFALAMETHKFEASYNDNLLGALPEAADVYRERSPIFAVDKISDPVAIYQGADDKVVPKNQADQIVATLQRRNVPHVYHVYEGEGHGWRKAETIQHFYESVMDFLKVHLLFR